jgi:FkbM family methyltransferase
LLPGTIECPPRIRAVVYAAKLKAYSRNSRNIKGQDVPDFVTNFLGGLTDITFVSGITRLSGVVEDHPVPANFHGETLEWIGTLRSVLEATANFVMLELGAGWGPWCVIGYLAAKQRRIESITVISVEGDTGHVTFIGENFKVNGIDEYVGKIIHGVVGVADGQAGFPKANDASGVYGGTASFSTTGERNDAFDNFMSSWSGSVERVEQLPCFSLSTLMRDYDQVDLIHCDIQGGEAKLFAGALDIVTAKVKRLVIGTHSHEIDRHLVNLFAANGWVLEAFSECVMKENSGKPVEVLDGSQLWRNPRLTPVS